MLIDLSQIRAAEERIRPYLAPTPVVRSVYFSELTGAEVYFKLEMLQPTHSFKVRGAFNAVLALSDDRARSGVVTASGGNHGLGVALAAARRGIPAAIYLPVHTPAVKIQAIRQLGAEVILHGDVWDTANRKAMEVARDQGKSYIHPFDNPYVMAGQGTIVNELIQQVPGLNLLIASIGGGGLISGLLSASKQQIPAARVVGVETIGADCMYQSRQAGRLIELPAITSVAESLGAKKTEQTQFDIVAEYVTDLVRVSDEEAIRMLLTVLQQEKLLVEPAASCCLAALAQRQIAYQPGEVIVVVVCGANVAVDQVIQWRERFGA